MHQRLGQTYSNHLLSVKRALRGTGGGPIDPVCVRGPLYDRTYGCCWEETEGSINNNSAAVIAARSISPLSSSLTLLILFPHVCVSFDNPSCNPRCEEFDTAVFEKVLTCVCSECEDEVKRE